MYESSGGSRIALRGICFRQRHRNAEGVEGWDTLSQENFEIFRWKCHIFCCIITSFEQTFNL